MITIIPALIDDNESERLLNITLSKIPVSDDSIVVLITQNRKPSIIKLDNIKHLKWEHYKKPIGKWAAIRRGQEIIQQYKRQKVALLDGDDPVELNSLTSAYGVSHSMGAKFLIGSRKEIVLYASDEISAKSRMYFELFSNTLLLQKLAQIGVELSSNAPDIQNGFYIMDSTIFQSIDLSRIENYGGELTVFYQLSTLGYGFVNCEIESSHRRSSCYNIKQIVNSVFSLPFFVATKESEIKKAIIMTPKIYGRYFEIGDYSIYANEIRLILKTMVKNQAI